jgi:hypothetical protein
MTAVEAGGWDGLQAELDAWTAAGRRADVWWRDDDAGAPCPALDRLLALAAETKAPVALAVIPLQAAPALAARLDGHAAETTVLQHGATHENRAAAGAKKCELIDPAVRPAVLPELLYGRETLSALFGRRFRPVMVPPWNRIDARLAGALPALGFAGLSTYKARPAAQTGEAAAGLQQVNCHVDILQWRPERRFLGREAALALLTGHLAAKRTGAADAAEPTGILTHHQAHDEAAWAFLGDLLGRLVRHAAVDLLAADSVFPAAGPADAEASCKQGLRA